MVTIILPGYSINNKEWALTTAEKLEMTHNVRPILWDHWDDPDKPFKPEEKARLIIDITHGDTINLVAKSIGTLVAALIIQRSPTSINKVILCGIPLNDINEEQKEVIKQALAIIPGEKIICFQNDEDPHGSFGAAAKFYLEISSDIKVISKVSATHDYPYFEEFEKFLKD